MDHTFYIVMSYGASALALAVEIVAIRLRRTRALRDVERERDLEAQD